MRVFVFFASAAAVFKLAAFSMTRHFLLSSFILFRFVLFFFSRKLTNDFKINLNFYLRLNWLNYKATIIVFVSSKITFYRYIYIFFRRILIL